MKCITNIFLSEGKLPNVIFEASGFERKLYLHKATLKAASSTFASLFSGKESSYCTFDNNTRLLQWTVETDDETYYNVLLKWLRFCYGDEISFAYEECAAEITTLNHQRAIRKQ